MTSLLLIRHGQAAHNVEGRWEGWSETPLTGEGQRQAQALALRLASWTSAIDRLYSSPLRRAWQTAESLAQPLGLTPIPHDGLCEIDFGQVSGLTMEAFQESLPEVYGQWRNRNDLTFQFPGGEQRWGFFRRVGATLDEIVAQHRGEQVLIVAHGGTLRAGLAHLLPDSMSDWWAYDLNNASLTHVRIEDGMNTLAALNDCRHLDGT
ncbi:MAG: histidine phosphatase family protein [Anaerolineae bacterium]|jgi:broad specificity phosphatase PhoE